jgi:hypothetical protein
MHELTSQAWIEFPMEVENPSGRFALAWRLLEVRAGGR